MARSNGGFWADFRAFILKGNVIDLAVAVIIGAAFTKIIDSLVTDIITPALLNPALKAANVENLAQLTIPGTAIKYGAFLAAVISFLIIAFCLFLIIRAFEKVQRRFARQQEEAAAVTDPAIESQARLAAALDRLTDTIETGGKV